MHLKYLFAILFLLSYTATYAQLPEDDPFRIQSDVFGPIDLGTWKIDAASMQGFKVVPGEVNGYLYKGDMETCELAWKVTADSYQVIGDIPFNNITGITLVRFNTIEKGLVLRTHLSFYGSGGGTFHDGLMVVKLGEQPQSLFKVVYSCGDETFARQYGDDTVTEAATYEYVRKVEIKGSDVILYPNTKELDDKNEEMTCEITQITSGTYSYHEGRYIKTK